MFSAGDVVYLVREAGVFFLDKAIFAAVTRAASHFGRSGSLMSLATRQDQASLRLGHSQDVL